MKGIITSIFISLLPMQISTAVEESKSVSLSLRDAEQYFKEHNLMLLAEHYEIQMADAAILQAKLFENPTLSFEQNIYNRINGRYFDFGQEGETAIEVEQLIYVAGQRNKRVKLEKINKEMAVYQLKEVARTLLSELKLQFLELYYTNKSRIIYDRQISSLNNLLTVYRLQEQQGNISKLEKNRIEALLLSLKKERNEVDNRIISLQEEVKLLLGLDKSITFTPLLDERLLNPTDFMLYPFSELLEYAYERPNVLLSKAKIRASEADIKLQRSLAAPEVSIVGKYDKAGNFINDYWAVGLSVSLPIFNRNQGNIKAAKLRLKQSQLMETYSRQKAESELLEGYDRLRNALSLYQEANRNALEKDLTPIMEGLNKSLESRDISLLEFVDYYETYKTNCLQLNQIEKDFLQAVENVNIIIGKNIFNY